LQVGSDIVNADFGSYRSNAWTVVNSTNNRMQSVFAGASGESYQVFDSTNLSEWFAFTNILVPLSGIVELNEPVTGRARFFKSSRP
jgi:hypothetical protein